jgi:hypothetical protein
MSRRDQGLAERRQELVERSAAQRAALAALAEPMLRRTATIDRIASSLRRYPVAAALGVGALVLIGPRKLFDLGTRALTLYILFRGDRSKFTARPSDHPRTCSPKWYRAISRARVTTAA